MNKISKKIFWICFIFLIAFAATAVFAQAANPPVALPAITAVTVMTILTAAASLAADYFPGFAGWYDALSVAVKRQLSLVGAVVLVGGVFGLTCAGVVTSNFVCSVAGGWNVLSEVIYVFAIGQAVHAGARPTAEFKADTLKIDPAKAGA